MEQDDGIPGTTDGSASQAGWYPDPTGQTRWWDGQSWTDRIETAAGLAAGPAVVPADDTGRPRRTVSRALVGALVGGLALLLLLGGGLAWWLTRSDSSPEQAAVGFHEAQIRGDQDAVCRYWYPRVQQYALDGSHSRENPLSLSDVAVPGSEEDCAQQNAASSTGGSDDTERQDPPVGVRSRTEDVEVDGDKAAVTVISSWTDTHGDERDRTMRYVLFRVDGQWRVGGILE